jgi:hypothetical protein
VGHLQYAISSRSFFRGIGIVRKTYFGERAMGQIEAYLPTDVRGVKLHWRIEKRVQQG